jgi:AhpD family alkylhydroperoxidase
MLKQARMKNPFSVIPEALQALLALDRCASNETLPPVTRKLVQLRASQINGCSVCVDMHSRELRKTGEKDECVFTVAAWQDAPYFSPAERAALALTEAVTRLSDRADPVPDPIWEEVARYYDERALASLVIQIAAINAFNRINVATRQITGPWVAQVIDKLK